MTDITAAIIDDELPAARLLFSMVNSIRPEWHTHIVPGSISEASLWLDHSGVRPDIMFLDIQLSDGTSFGLVDKLPTECMIVFTTAYDEYALRAFDLNSIDYLLKPIRVERLETAIAKFERYHNAGLLGCLSKYLARAMHEDAAYTYRERLLVSAGRKLYTLQIDDVAYFRSEDKITIATTWAGTEHIVDPPLSSLEQQLDPKNFFRANRQFIVSAKSVRSIEPYFGGRWAMKTSPNCKEPIIISREKASALKVWLNS